MKKLMTMIAAVGMAFGLFADTNLGTSFEGESFEVGPITAVTAAEKAQWTVPSGATADVALYGEAGKVTGDNRPAAFTGDQLKYLNVKTTLGSPIVRAFENGGWDLTTGKVFFDGLVKFTNFDSDPENIDGKIAVWVKEIENEDETITTNLMVTAGSDKNGTPVNYLVWSDYEPTLNGGWSRVTIKAIPTILANEKTDPVPGFVVWVDGALVGAAESKAAINNTGYTLSNIAKSYNDQKNLFLSIDQTSTDISTITGVAFDGQGQIDDVLLTTAVPNVPQAADPKFFTVDAGDNVVSVSIDGAEAIAKANLPATVQWDGVSAIGVTAVYATGFIDGEWTASDESVVINQSEANYGTFLPTADGQSGTIVAKAALVKVGDKYYGSLAEALADTDALTAAGGEVTLQNNLTIAVDEEVTTEYEDMITIDLSGNEITYEGTETAITAAKLTVLDSTTEGTTADSGAIVAENGTAIVATEELVIKNGKFNGIVIGTAGAIGGWYIADPTDMEIVADGYKASPIEQDPYAFEIVKSNPGTVIFVCSATSYTSDPVTAVNQKVTKPEDDVIDFQKVYTVKAGKWYKDDQFAEEFDFANDTIADDTQVPLYAQADIVLAQDANDNYLIAKAADLVKLEKLMLADNGFTAGKTFLQTADIDMADYADATGAQLAWNGLGSYPKSKSSVAPFQGTYDGQGFTIDNLYLTRTWPGEGKHTYGGLFNTVAGNGIVENLIVNGVKFDAEDPVATEVGFGGIAGYIKGNAQILRCKVTGQMGTVENPLCHSTGGIVAVGESGDNMQIVDCTNEATIVVGSIADNPKLGGIIGVVNNNNTKLIRCVNKGSIVCTSVDITDTGCGLGQLLGYTGNTVTLQDCVAAGSIQLSETPGVMAAGQVVGRLTANGVITIVGTVVAPAGAPIGSLYNYKKDTQVTTYGKPGVLAFSQAGQATGTVVYAPLAKENTYDVVMDVAAETTAFTLAAENDWIAFKPATGVTFAGTVAVADTETLEVKSEAIEGGTKFTAVKKSVGPTPVDPTEGDCTVTPNGDGSFTVTPKAGSKTATIKGVTADVTIKIDSAADFVLTADAAPKAIVMELNGSVVEAKYFIGGDATVGFNTALSDEAKATLVTETEEQKPLVIGDNVDVTINTVAGLKYQLIRGTEVGAITEALGEPVVGDGQALKLTDNAKPEGKAFYVIKTSK